MIRRLVEKIICVFWKDGYLSYAYVQIYFRTGIVRTIGIFHKPEVSGIQSVARDLRILAVTSSEKLSTDLRGKVDLDALYASMQTVFPSYGMIAKRIDALDIPPKEKVAIWENETGKSKSQFYRKLRP